MNRADLQALLDKGIISQQTFDMAIPDDERDKPNAEALVEKQPQENRNVSVPYSGEFRENDRVAAPDKTVEININAQPESASRGFVATPGMLAQAQQPQDTGTGTREEFGVRQPTAQPKV